MRWPTASAAVAGFPARRAFAGKQGTDTVSLAMAVFEPGGCVRLGVGVKSAAVR